MVKNNDKAEKAVKKARKSLNPLTYGGLASGSVFKASDGEEFTLDFKWSCSLSADENKWIFDLFRRNMREMYMASQWGYDEHSKRQELESTTARFLMLRDSNDLPIGYAHFRFVVENTHPVLYCYEIQFERRYQNRRLGSQLLAAMESVSAGSGMDRMMVTVFSFNEPSLSFFRRAGYEVDDFSPDPDQKLDYVILSKRCEVMGTKKTPLKSVNV